MRRDIRVFFLLTTLVGLLAADPLDLQLKASVNENADNSFTYFYTLTNNAGSSENVFAFSIAYRGSLTGIVSPTDWTPVSELGYLSWVSEDPTSDLAPGRVDDFAFTSLLGPGPTPFSAFGSDPFTGFPTGDMTSGTIAGPVSGAPEPGTFALLSFVGLLIVSTRILGRTRKVRSGAALFVYRDEFLM